MSSACSRRQAASSALARSVNGQTCTVLDREAVLRLAWRNPAALNGQGQLAQPPFARSHNAYPPSLASDRGRHRSRLAASPSHRAGQLRCRPRDASDVMNTGIHCCRDDYDLAKAIQHPGAPLWSIIAAYVAARLRYPVGAARVSALGERLTG